MWSIDATTKLLETMSAATDPQCVVRLFFDHVRKHNDVYRAFVLDMSVPSCRCFRLVEAHGCENDTPAAAVPLIPKGGILEDLVHSGQIQNIRHPVVNPGDPATDLLKGCASLMAFPIFRGGAITGLVVLLSSDARLRDTTELCALATMTSLLGRVIEAQELADQLQTSCRALDAELKAAADVQRWLLPPSTPSSQKAGIAASYVTARRSGGDYYDAGELPDGRVGVFIADVSGKGAAAAVLMAVLRTIVHDEVDRAKLRGPAALLDYADARLCALGLPGRGAFVTAVSGILDTNTGKFTYSSAGHPPPRWLRARDRSIRPLDGANTVPLGLLEPRSVHTEESVMLDVGDLVLLYTDGITEARSPTGEFFGIDRVDRILSSMSEPLAPDSAIDAVSRAASRFAGDDTPADDQTLLALARRATPAM